MNNHDAHPYHYRPSECPGHWFGSNDGQPVDDHCTRCGTPYVRGVLREQGVGGVTPHASRATGATPGN